MATWCVYICLAQLRQDLGLRTNAKVTSDDLKIVLRQAQTLCTLWSVMS